MISIIIPIYNTSLFLNQCIKSIIAQTYTDWECILINDGSTDNSGDICNSWSQKDKRIHVIHQRNSGVSVARNKGLDIAKGEFITFIDSDDWIDKFFLESMLKHSKGSDLVVSGLIRNYINGTTEEYTPLKTEYFPINEHHVNKFVDLNKKNLLYAPHEKLYRTDIINIYHIRFTIGCNYGEDLIFNYEYLQYVENISTIDIALYHYRILENTLSTKLRYNQFENDYSQWLIIKKFYEQRNLLNNSSLEYLYKRLWGIIYDGIFIYPYLNPKPQNYIEKILKIPEIKNLKKYRNVFHCSKWIKNAILDKSIFTFNIYFTIFSRYNKK